VLESAILVPVFSFGVLVGGSGDLNYECEDSGVSDGTLFDPPACSSSGIDSEVEYDDESDFVLAVDLLGHLSPNFRLGGGIQWLPNPDHSFEVRALGESYTFDVDSGHELDAYAVAEGIFPLSAAVAALVRAQAGIAVLIPEDEHQELFVDQHREYCKGSGLDPCTTGEGPFVGPTFGVGGGLAILAGDVRLRAELRLEWFWLPYARYEEAGGGTRTKEDYDLSGSRTILFAGVEL
jgi:hypothetical protein